MKTASGRCDGRAGARPRAGGWLSRSRSRLVQQARPDSRVDWPLRRSRLGATAGSRSRESQPHHGHGGDNPPFRSSRWGLQCTTRNPFQEGERLWTTRGGPVNFSSDIHRPPCRSVADGSVRCRFVCACWMLPSPRSIRPICTARTTGSRSGPAVGHGQHDQLGRRGGAPMPRVPSGRIGRPAGRSWCSSPSGGGGRDRGRGVHGDRRGLQAGPAVGPLLEAVAGCGGPEVPGWRCQASLRIEPDRRLFREASPGSSRWSSPAADGRHAAGWRGWPRSWRSVTSGSTELGPWLRSGTGPGPVSCCAGRPGPSTSGAAGDGGPRRRGVRDAVPRWWAGRRRASRGGRRRELRRLAQ